MPDNLIYGRHPILESLQASKNFDKLFVQKRLRHPILQQIIQLAENKQIPIQQVPIEKLNRLTNRKNHQGVAGFLSLIHYYTVEDVLSDVYAKGNIPLFLLCDGITDVRNFGAIVRTAACMGVHAVIITAKGSANINADTIKASAGALHQVPICKVRFLDRTIKYLQTNGLRVVASGLQTTNYIHQQPLDIPVALIIGAEGKGVASKHLQMADAIAKLPMAGQFDSYNVSVATGLLLYEAMKQRQFS